MKKILITGVNGFIGSRVAQACLQNRDLVYGIDLHDSSQLELERYYQQDIVQENLCSVICQCQPDIIVHCAGSADVRFSVDNPRQDFDRNVKATHNLFYSLLEAKQNDCRVILLSSAAVYGNPTRLPIQEDDPRNPISPYALHKKMAEDIGLYFLEHYHYDVRILRVFSAYGPGLRKQLFWDMYQKAINTEELQLYGTGYESRDYIYIDDLIRVISLLMYQDKIKYHVFNVANGKEIRIKDIAEMFMNEMMLSNEKIRFNDIIREGDPINWCADISRISELGYVANVTIADGIRAYIKWCSK